jgi:hypothetical protein
MSSAESTKVRTLATFPEQAIHLTARDFTQAIGPPADIPGDEPCVRI